VATREIDVDGDVIRLAQFLKISGAIDTGGEAKIRIVCGEVLVNGQVEMRRGRQLHDGDVVEFEDDRMVVVVRDR
jgi:ribosome-associated protein